MSVINRYGLIWRNQDDLQIEFECIKRGGKWKMPNGQEYGEGLFKHYRNAQSLAWPDEDHHLWSDLMLQTILEQRITVVQGSRDSGKTRGISKYALIDYWAFPTETLILMSSTDIRGLELRVWGDIKDLLDRAKSRYPWLPGNVVDAKHGVFTDALGDDGEVRDMRRGIICIPCLGSDGQWAGGLEKFIGIKQKRRRLLGDECFPAGTMVDTPDGPRAIETIIPGDVVTNLTGIDVVEVVSNQRADTLLEITGKNGREIICTPNHKILTQKGWISACEINQQHYMLSTYEAMSIMWSRLSPSLKAKILRFLPIKAEELCWLRKSIRAAFSKLTCSFLQHVLSVEMVDGTRRVEEKVLHKRESREIENRKDQMAQGSQGAFSPDREEDEESFSRKGNYPKAALERDNEGNWSWSEVSWWERDRANPTRIATIENDSWWNMELLCQDRPLERKRIPPSLQSGCGITGHKAGDRGRRSIPRANLTQGQGRKEGRQTSGTWVDSVEVYKQANNGLQESGASAGGHRVYNLQVARHPSYSVNGLAVHNCQFMHINYINTLSNLDKGSFKGCFVGNPIGGNGKALDKLAEPVAGWDSLGEIAKTTTWKNRFDGVTINLVGIDSPNFDPNRPKDYPYLVDQSDVDRVMKRSGKDSAEFWSQIMGVRKIGVDAYRVLTRSMCLKFGAFDSCIWGSEATTKVLGIDAGFGGDPCECIMIEFGKDVLGQTVVKFNPTITIPIQITATDTAEDQIAIFTKSLIQDLNVPPGHVGFEAGMRATLAISMARIVSNEVNAVNVGGPATDRPVNNEMYIFDEVTKGRRLKRCNEHYSKFITEIWFAIQQVVKSRQMRELPEDVMNEFAMREWRFVANNRYELETKQECKERMGSSPNKADAASVAMEMARRLGFEIESMKADGVPISQDDWMAKELQKQRQQQKKHELNYRT